MNSKTTEAAFADEEKNDSYEKSKKSAVIYMRIATGRQDVGSSIEIQRSGCLRYCEDNDIAVLNEFVDCCSANMLDKPNYNKAVEYAVMNCVDHIVIHDYTRVSRSITLYAQLTKSLEPSGISIIAANEPEQSSGSAEQLVSTVICSVSEYLSDIHSNRTRKGMRFSKLQGKMVHRPPIGYKICKPNLYTSTAIDRTTAEFVKKAFELYASGEYSVKEVNKKLTEMGLENPRTQKPYLPASTKRMLSNPIYIGKVWVDDEIGFVTGNFEPIVDEVLYAKVQEILKKRSRVS